MLPDDAVPLVELPEVVDPDDVDESDSEPELAVPEEPVAASSDPVEFELDPLQPTATANPRAIDIAETFRKADIEVFSVNFMSGDPLTAFAPLADVAGSVADVGWCPAKMGAGTSGRDVWDIYLPKWALAVRLQPPRPKGFPGG